MKASAVILVLFQAAALLAAGNAASEQEGEHIKQDRDGKFRKYLRPSL